MREHICPALGTLCDPQAARTKKWFALELVVKRINRVVHFGFTILFIVLLGVAWSGQPLEAPSNIFQILWVGTALKLISIAIPTLKHSYLKKDASRQATAVESLITVIVSAACIGMVAFLYLHSRGESKLVPIGDWDWQRAVMVWVYWVFSFFLMQVYGIPFGFTALVLTFTGCCFFGCCNVCGRGPLFKLLHKARRQRSQTQNKTRKYVAAKRSAASIEMQVDATSVWRLRDVDAVDIVSKDAAEPIIDFVENKAQISVLTPVRLAIWHLEHSLTCPLPLSP